MVVAVFLNIYDLTTFNKYLHPIGLGAYHSGIQIFDVEFSYGAHPFEVSGVIETQPFCNKNFILRISIKLGDSTLKLNEINKIITDIKHKYIGSQYDIFKNNCNHFSNDLSNKLLNKNIPNFVNRLCNYSKIFRCFLSKKLIYGDALTVKPGKIKNLKNQIKIPNDCKELQQNSCNLMENVNLNESQISKLEFQKTDSIMDQEKDQNNSI